MSADEPLDQAIAALEALAHDVPAAPGRVHLDGDTLWLDHPPTRNALTVGMMADLARCVRTLRASDRRWVVLRGAGGTFCSGGHLGQVRAALVEPAAGQVMCQAMTIVLDALATAPCLVIACVEGAARGGGAELLTAADHRLFAPDATVGFVQARLGITPGWGATARLVRQIGPTEALRWLSTAEVRDAEHLGLFADRVGPVDETLAGFVAPLRSIPVVALHAVKAAVLAERPLLRTGGEADVFGRVWGGPVHRKALR